MLIATTFCWLSSFPSPKELFGTCTFNPKLKEDVKKVNEQKDIKGCKYDRKKKLNVIIKIQGRRKKTEEILFLFYFT